MSTPIPSSSGLPANYYDLTDAMRELEAAQKDFDNVVKKNTLDDGSVSPSVDNILAQKQDVILGAETRVGRAAIYQTVQTGTDYLSKAKADIEKIETVYPNNAAVINNAQTELGFIQQAMPGDTGRQIKFLESLDVKKWNSLDMELNPYRWSSQQTSANLYEYDGNPDLSCDFACDISYEQSSQTSHDNGAESQNGYVLSSGDKGDSTFESVLNPDQGNYNLVDQNRLPLDERPSYQVRLSVTDDGKIIFTSDIEDDKHPQPFTNSNGYVEIPGLNLVNADGSINQTVLDDYPGLQSVLPSVQLAIEKLKPQVQTYSTKVATNNTAWAK
jgi:hypothetical protein